MYQELELHLAPMPLSRSQAKRIEACGGKYSEVRGYSNKRFVHVPATEQDLINELVRKHAYEFTKNTTMIARFRGAEPVAMPSWVVVQTVNPHAAEAPTEQFARKFEAAKRQAQKRGIIK